MKMNEKGLRYNEGKPKWSLVDFKSLEPMVRVLEYGAEKYTTKDCSGRDNWKKGMPVQEVCESMLRHTFALLEGEMIDSESGKEHIGHVQANAMFIAYMLREKSEFNNLPKKEK